MVTLLILEVVEEQGVAGVYLVVLVVVEDFVVNKKVTNYESKCTVYYFVNIDKLTYFLSQCYIKQIILTTKALLSK